MSVGQLARHRSSSSGTRPLIRSTTPVRSVTTSLSLSPDLEFEPCAATASIFLYAQERTIVCLHHDTLALERRFERHKERIIFLSVDNVSERGAGRLVVSYDASQTAIVWDLFSGDEIARFASYEPIRVAAWMKNGNVAFGNWPGMKGKRQELTPNQGIRKETLYSSSLQPQNMFLREQSSILSLPLRQRLIVKHMLLGQSV